MEIFSLVLIVAATLAVLAVVVLAWSWYMGFFSKIYIQLKEVPEMTILFVLYLLLTNRNMNYTGAMKDTYRGYKDMERRTRELLGDLPRFPVMGGVYYTSPSEVKVPGICMEWHIMRRG